MAEQRKLTTISLTSELFDKIEKYRWDHHMNRSEFFVNAVKMYIGEDQKKDEQAASAAE